MEERYRRYTAVAKLASLFEHERRVAVSKEQTGWLLSSSPRTCERRTCAGRQLMYALHAVETRRPLNSAEKRTSEVGIGSSPQKSNDDKRELQHRPVHRYCHHELTLR